MITAIPAHSKALSVSFHRTMVAMVPMTLRGIDKSGEHGNQVGFTVMPVHTEIEDPLERKRLKGLINELSLPVGVGVIVRTAGEGKKARYFVRDLHIRAMRVAARAAGGVATFA